MRCRNCKMEIEDGSLFCRFCGQKQLKEKRKKSQLPKDIRKLKNGSISGRVMVDGVRVRIVARSEADFLAHADAYRHGYLPLPNKCNGMTVAQAVAEYAESRKNRHKASTSSNYDYIIRCRFKELMEKDVMEVDEDILDKAVERELGLPSRKGGTIAPKTVIDAYNLVISAIKKQRPDFEPVVALPDIPRQFPVVLPMSTVVPVLAGTDMELPGLLAMQYAMSASEIRGLTKSKSIRDGKLYIVETVVDVDGVPVRSAGDKEPDRPRVFDITPRIQALIDQVDGNVIEPRSAHALNERLKRLLRNAGLPEMSFHKLRHIAATVMAEENIPANIAQERGGWKTDDTMKKVYVHTFTEPRKEADERVNQRIEKAYDYPKITQKDS